MTYQTNDKLRPIRINFSAYGGNDDDEFKHELITLMANSVLELREAALQSIEVKHADIFRKAAHKAKSTLVLLADNDFINAVENVRHDLVSSESDGNFQVRDENLKLFLSLCASVIRSLEKEAQLIKP